MDDEQAQGRGRLTVHLCREEVYSVERCHEAEILSKKNPPTEGGLNPILGGVGGDRSIMLHCTIFRQSSFVMRCITGGNDTLIRDGEQLHPQFREGAGCIDGYRLGRHHRLVKLTTVINREIISIRADRHFHRYLGHVHQLQAGQGDCAAGGK